jgi:hypothetical protein
MTVFIIKTAEAIRLYSGNSSYNTYPSLFESHPTYPWLHLEKQKVDFTPGYVVVTSGYAGIAGGQSETTHIYELCLGLGEEPIETHPKFQSEIAGSPSSPLNGAIFIDFETGKKTMDDNRGVFDRFQNTLDGVRNTFAGISAYLDLAQITWRERYVTNTRPSDGSDIGYKDTPSGPAPSVVAHAYWLYAGLTYDNEV